MFVDACAIVALLAEEPEAERVANALTTADSRITSPVALLEAVIALARADKFDLPLGKVEQIVMEFLDARGIELCQLPPPEEAARLALHAAAKYRGGRSSLNLGDCLHYACARHYDVPMLATGSEFRNTDLATVP